MGSSRNRNAGNGYERDLVNRYNDFGFTSRGGVFIPMFPSLGTTRNLSTYMDSLKVDLMTVDATRFKEFGLLIQAKNTTAAVSYPKILSQMEDAVKIHGNIPVIYHKQTARAPGKERFLTQGEYVILYAKDFETIFTKMRLYKEAFEEFQTYFDSLGEDAQKELNTFLTERNL